MGGKIKKDHVRREVEVLMVEYHAHTYFTLKTHNWVARGVPLDIIIIQIALVCTHSTLLEQDSSTTFFSQAAM